MCWQPPAPQDTVPVDVAVVAASPQDRPIVERLLQLYEYDVSDFMDEDLDAEGVYQTTDTEAIWRPGRHTILVKVDGKLAGFALIARHQSYLGDGGTHLVEEFFVMRKYRRRGVGEHVARTLFDRFPGRWEVSTTHQNTAAQAFWRRVIGRYTNDAYREVAVDSDRWRGPVWTFGSPGP
jgi:predicted acetyltransferase